MHFPRHDPRLTSCRRPTKRRGLVHNGIKKLESLKKAIKRADKKNKKVDRSKIRLLARPLQRILSRAAKQQMSRRASQNFCAYRSNAREADRARGSSG
jgi:hypothetical protein